MLFRSSTIEEGRLAKGGSKLTDEYTKECAVCEMNLADFLAMGSPDRVKITSRDGHSVVVYAYGAERLFSGQVFMPRAIWSNVVVDPETFSSGSPLYKGSPVKVEPSNDMVLSAEEITAKLYMLQKRG